MSALERQHHRDWHRCIGTSLPRHATIPINALPFSLQVFLIYNEFEALVLPVTVRRETCCTIRSVTSSTILQETDEWLAGGQYSTINILLRDLSNWEDRLWQGRYCCAGLRLFTQRMLRQCIAKYYQQYGYWYPVISPRKHWVCCNHDVSPIRRSCDKGTTAIFAINLILILSDEDVYIKDMSVHYYF